MCSCDMSVSNPLVTPIHNKTTCVNMVKFLQNGCMCVLKDIVDVKKLDGFYCMARQCSPLRRKLMEYSIINPALSLLMKHLVIGQR